jgi:hypothetical protein
MCRASWRSCGPLGRRNETCCAACVCVSVYVCRRASLRFYLSASLSPCVCVFLTRAAALQSHTRLCGGCRARLQLYSTRCCVLADKLAVAPSVPDLGTSRPRSTYACTAAVGLSRTGETCKVRTYGNSPFPLFRRLWRDDPTATFDTALRKNTTHFSESAMTFHGRTLPRRPLARPRAHLCRCGCPLSRHPSGDVWSR